MSTNIWNTIKLRVIAPALCVCVSLAPAALYLFVENKELEEYRIIESSFIASGTMFAQFDTNDCFAASDDLERTFYIFAIDTNTEIESASGHSFRSLDEIPLNTKIIVYHNGKDTRKFKRIRDNVLHDNSLTGTVYGIFSANGIFVNDLSLNDEDIRRTGIYDKWPHHGDVLRGTC